MTFEQGFTDEDARAAWNEGAEAWEVAVEGGADYYRHEVHGPGLLAACGDVAGSRVLDLGCGQGFFTRQLARRGARVTGVDLSDRLLELARGHEEREPLGIGYHRMSAAEADRRWPEGSFDLVSACMSLHDMADPGAALRAAFAVLRPGGRMAFSVPHPFSDMPFREWERDEAGRKLALRVDRYFDTGPAVTHWNMPRLVYHWRTPYWRHTLEETSEMIAAAGFLVRRMYEPHPAPEQVRRMPQLDDCSRLPYFLVFDAVKPA
ncbi:MAG TPA: class I SAM-dependent methyltransferase [Longimicrobium sp.]|jgi:2-polyprenyl-3-methyl-5-hydroxy-6-metoxy-1,4-benzoquinol methylase